MTNALPSITDLADHAAAQPDRWWIAALFALGLLGTATALRWIVRDREHLAEAVAAAHTRALDQTSQLVRVIDANTSAMTALGNKLENLERFCALRRPPP